LGIQPEWWKIGALHKAESWQQLDALIEANDPYCKGVVLLGLAAPLEDVASGFGLAAASRHCKGFTVGRTIFQAPSEAWLAGRINDDELIQQIRDNFETLITAWASARHQTTATV
jgi:5-dehydro-2-deoxygluconokinase